MSLVIMLALWLDPSHAIEPNQCTPTYACQCGPGTTVDGWKIYMVETCGEKERWLPLERDPGQFSDAFECTDAITAQPEC